MNKKVNWKLVWEKFAKWVDNPPQCKHCGQMNFRSWERQAKKIEQLVEKSLKCHRKDK